MKSGVRLELRCLACDATLIEGAEAPYEDDAFKNLEDRYFAHLDARHPEPEDDQ